MTDLTTVPIGSGFWTTWLPFSLPQCWPFCRWVGVIIDHYSRRIMGVTLFWQEPTSEAMRAFLGRVMHATKATQTLGNRQGAPILERRLQAVVPA